MLHLQILLKKMCAQDILRFLFSVCFQQVKSSNLLVVGNAFANQKKRVREREMKVRTAVIFDGSYDVMT